MSGFCFPRPCYLHIIRHARRIARSGVSARHSASVLESSKEVLPFSEKDLSAMEQYEMYLKPQVDEHLSEMHLKPQVDEHLSDTKTKQTHDGKSLRHAVQQDAEPLTLENQYDNLAKVLTPLHNVSYEKQLEMKEKEALNILKKFCHILKKARSPLAKLNHIPMGIIRESPETEAYRNNTEFSVNVGVDGNPKTVGFYYGQHATGKVTCIPPTYLRDVRQSHKIVAKHFQGFIEQSQYLPCTSFKEGGVWRVLQVRSNLEGSLMATVIIYPDDLQEDEIQGIESDLKNYFFNGPGAECQLSSLYFQVCKHSHCSRRDSPYRLIAGNKHITETCLGKTFQISPDSFFQINTKAAEALYESIGELSEVSLYSTILDLYCGVGPLSIILSSEVRGAIGMDTATGAIEDAKANAVQNDIKNAVFIEGKVEKILPRVTKEIKDCVDIVAIVNPTRGGLSPKVARTIRGCESISKLIYVCCQPTLRSVENLADLCLPTIFDKDVPAPFIPRYALPIDMSPHTNYVDLILLFERE